MHHSLEQWQPHLGTLSRPASVFPGDMIHWRVDDNDAGEVEPAKKVQWGRVGWWRKVILAQKPVVGEAGPAIAYHGPVPNPMHDGNGRKDDVGKDRFDLLPGDALKAIAVILTFGAKKYAPRNWEAGMDWSRVYGALQRHLWAWWQGEPKDAETGHSHLWHAGTCLLFLIAYEIRGTGTDDRPK